MRVPFPTCTRAGQVQHPGTGYTQVWQLFDSLGGLDEKYPWTRAITKLQADLLRAGCSVQAIRDYQRLLLHFGGKSGEAYKTVHKKVELSEVASWFEGAPPVTVIPELHPE